MWCAHVVCVCVCLCECVSVCVCVCVCVCVWRATGIVCWLAHSVVCNAVQASLKKELEESKLPDKLKFFEKLSAKSGAPEGWLFGKVSPLFHYR